VVVAFNDTPNEDPAAHRVLATQGQVGAVNGLAYDPGRQALYAAAYHRRGSALGPGGPGAVYRIDLATPAVTTLVSLSAGPDRHDVATDEDQAAADWVGKAGLGDIEVDAQDDVLFVTNLYDNRIYRVGLADGAVRGSFLHGAAGESWRVNARLFGLAFRDGWLYHGVVNSRERTTSSGLLSGYVFRSRAGGAEMSEVLRFNLDYGRSVPWRPWEKLFPSFQGSARPPLGQPMPAGIGFNAAGDLVIGLRDRVADMIPVADASSGALGVGDVLPTRREGEGWQVITDPERYEDDANADESGWGTLAGFPVLDLVVTPAMMPVAADGVGAFWLDNGSGEMVRREALLPFASDANPLGSTGLGDVVLLCARPDDADPAAAATATALVATATAEAQATIDTPREAITTGCRGDNPYFAITCFSRDLSSAAGRREPAIVAFNDSEDEDPNTHFALATQLQVGATYGLAYDWRRRQLYAAAYHKRGTQFGPGGPGQIYRLDLETRTATAWAALDAGPDTHQNNVNFDEPASGYVGKTSLGDIDLDEAGATLFVMNLFDRRIYRLAVPDGTPLGSFDHGAAGEDWAENARPFALGYRDGWLYHGVLNALEGGGPGELEARVYRSRPDGGQMAEAARFGLDYPHIPAWNPWATTPIFADPPAAMPMLSDIEFRPNGELLLGLRDRQADMSVYIGYGDLLPTRPEDAGDGWEVITTPERYQDDWIHQESLWGSLAAFPGRDWVVSSALAPWEPNSGGAAWFDSETGQPVRRETIYRGGIGFNKSQGLGDVELLCPPFVPPTSTAPPPTDTPSPTATATATPSATPTATPAPRPIYLPLLVTEECPQVYVDVTLVLDMSTSMRRLTREGRPKHAAAVAAATRFIGLLDLSSDVDGQSDQAAVVGFNRAAWTEQGLTADNARLVAALGRLEDRTAELTRLDLAVAQGAEAALGPGHRPGRVPVVILLTDGLPNQVPPAEDGRMETTILRAAQQAKDRGVRLHTIGVGAPNDIDEPLLVAMASDPRLYAYAPDAEDLVAIYAGLAGTIRCPPGRHLWGEPWP
jgi:hypothetical protein